MRLPREVTIEYTDIKKPDLKNPILIEGLSGVGNVGMLAAEHMIKKLRAKKLADVHSPHFTYSPSFIPGIESKDGIAQMLKDEIFYDWGHNLLILIGYYQGSTTESYYSLADEILEFCDEFGAKRIFTLGGYGTGRYIGKPKVYAVTTDRKLLEDVKKHGAVEMKGGMVTGISGILLGLGHEKGKKCTCLLGETHGSYSDPKAAEAVLRVLSSVIGIEIGMDELKTEQKLLEEEFSRGAVLMRKMKRQREERAREELRYIG